MVIVDRSQNLCNCFAAYAEILRRSAETFDIKYNTEITVRKILDFRIRKMLTIWFGLYNPNHGYFCNFCKTCENGKGWEKKYPLINGDDVACS